jgi:phosphoserine phosphatase
MPATPIKLQQTIELLADYQEEATNDAAAQAISERMSGTPTIMERARAVFAWIEQSGYSGALISEAAGLSRNVVSHMLRVEGFKVRLASIAEIENVMLSVTSRAELEQMAARRRRADEGQADNQPPSAKRSRRVARRQTSPSSKAV